MTFLQWKNEIFIINTTKQMIRIIGRELRNKNLNNR